jgi:anti-sigma B factor antagonist
MFSMDLTTPGCGGSAVVALRGDLDVADAATAAARLTAAAVRDRVLIVDLAGLDYIDASGLAALACARAHARQAGGDLLLTAPQRQVQRILAITRLSDVFGVHACAAGHTAPWPARETATATPPRTQPASMTPAAT